MADFRKWFVVLAMLSLFAGMAAAQSPFRCDSVQQVTPTLRAEGLTELVGDIVLTCTGGNPVAAGQAIPQANVIVSLSAPVTSRLQSSTTNASEALLIIDEPTAPIPTPVTGFFSQAPLSVCPSITGGCVEFATSANATVNGAATTIVVPTNTVGGATPGYNVFQGVVAGSNQVIFPGVPILPPATTGVSRTYRITNIRVNAGGAGGGLLAGFQPVFAYLSTSGPTSLPVGNQALTVGFIQNSLQTTASAVGTLFTQCNPVTGQQIATLNYTERFPSAFKTRVAPLTTAAGASYLATNAGTAPGTGQNVPGTLYNSESGFILGLPGNFTAGLADFGTRFKASFANLPVGVTIYVTQTNVGNSLTPAGSALYVGTNEAAAFPTTAPSTTLVGPAPASIPAVTVVTTTTANGLTSGTAVWEVVSNNLAANETFTFGVYISYTPGGTASNPLPTLVPVSGSPAPSVTQSYAPISSVTSAVTAATAGGSVPRFSLGANATTQPIISIVPCQTILLFPYVTSMAGLDTGIAISNTALDPLSPATLGSTGSCRLYFYGSNLSSTAIVPPTAVANVPSIGPIAPGNPDYTKSAFLASNKFGTDVTGYMFAVCDFQYAHGFAFISDAGLRNLAMGYLALVVTDGSSINRSGAQKGENLNN